MTSPTRARGRHGAQTGDAQPISETDAATIPATDVSRTTDAPPATNGANGSRTKALRAKASRVHAPSTDGSPSKNGKAGKAGKNGKTGTNG